MADEDEIDLVVVAREEQVQQDEETLGEILARLVHRARHVHQAEHHRLGGGHRHPDAVAKAQVDRVEERDAQQPRAQRRDLLLELVDLALLDRIVAVAVALQLDQLLFKLAQLEPRTRADRDAPADRAAHRAQHVQVVRRALGTEAGALALPLGRVGELRADHVRQRQVLEEDLHELLFAQRKGEIVFALAGVAGLALARAASAAALGALDAVTADVVLVARVHDLAHAALAVVEHRLGHVLLGDAHFFAALDVANAAAVDRALDRLANLRLVAAQESLAVADRLVLAGQTAVDDLKHQDPWRLVR